MQSATPGSVQSVFQGIGKQIIRIRAQPHLPNKITEVTPRERTEGHRSSEPNQSRSGQGPRLGSAVGLGLLLKTKKYQGHPRHPVENQEIQRKSKTSKKSTPRSRVQAWTLAWPGLVVGFLDFLDFLDFLGISWFVLWISWISLVFLGFSFGSIGFPWYFLVSHLEFFDFLCKSNTSR